MLQSGQAQSGRDEKRGWHGQQGLIVEGVESQAEEHVTSPSSVLCHTGYQQNCSSQVEPLLPFVAFSYTFPLVEDLSLGPLVIMAPGWRLGRRDKDPESLG